MSSQEGGLKGLFEEIVQEREEQGTQRPALQLNCLQTFQLEPTIPQVTHFNTDQVTLSGFLPWQQRLQSLSHRAPVFTGRDCLEQLPTLLKRNKKQE